MAQENFKPIVWSTAVLEQYNKSLVFGSLANTSYQGAISGFGSSVKINQVGRAAAVDYTGSAITYPKLDDVSMTLSINQKKVVPLTIADFDDAQTSPKLFQAHTNALSYGAADNVDLFIAALYASAGHVITGSTGTPTAITSATITELFNDATVALDEDNVPADMRVCVLPAWMVGKLRLAKVTKDTNNSEVLSNGFIGNYLGWRVYSSNNVSHSGTDWYAPMFFSAGETIAFASQIGGDNGGQIEIIRDKDYLETFMRLPLLYGAKVIRPESLAVMYVSNGSEA